MMSSAAMAVDSPIPVKEEALQPEPGHPESSTSDATKNKPEGAISPMRQDLEEKKAANGEKELRLQPDYIDEIG